VRLVTLHLERYGPFTGRTIALSRQAKLHVVYGPNEAGKTSALAAVTDLLFGIGRQTPYDFLHDGRDLRIGATLERNDGECLTFRRRRGNKGTIVDALDNPIRDDVLVPYLGGLTRDVFCNAFGLDADALRRGAEDMLATDGEVGASLFAAASGLRGLADLRRALDDEAGAIFGPRASKDRRFYQALDRFNEARKTIQGREVRAAYWQDLNDRIETHAHRLEELKALRAANAAERTRLARSKRTAPLMQLIDGDLARRSALEPIPDVPAGFGHELAEALAAVRTASDAQIRALADEAGAIRDHADVAVDEAVLARTTDVVRLMAETGAYASNRRDLPRIQAEADEYRGQVRQLAVRVGLGPEAAFEGRQPTDAAQALVKRLIAEGREIADALARSSAALISERAALADLDHDQLLDATMVNPQPLRDKAAALAHALKVLERRADLSREVGAEERSLREAASRLDPPVSDLTAVAASALPSVETISRFANDLTAVASDLQRDQDRLEAALATVADLEGKLLDLAATAPLASPEAVAAKRRQRDDAWRQLRARLLDPTHLPEPRQWLDGVGQFERHLVEADQLADNAVSDAERVAAHAAYVRRLNDERRKAGAARDRIATLEAKRQATWDAWTAAWSRVGIVPPHPANMVAWRIALEGLLSRRDKVEGQREVLVASEDTARAVEPAVRALAADVGLAAGDQAGDLPLVAAQIDERLRALAGTWDSVRDLEARRRDIQRRIAALTAAENEAARRLADWRGRWESAVPSISLQATATTDEAQAALDVWKQVPAAIHERDNRDRRVAGMRRDIDQFERDTKNVVDAIAPDLAGLPPDVAVKTLNERVTAATAAASRRDATSGRVATTIRARQAADAALDQVRTDVADLMASLPPSCDPSDLVATLTERETLDRSLAERRDQLLSQGDGYDEKALRNELADFSPGEVEGRLTVLTGEDQDFEREGHEVYAAHVQAVAERTAAEQGLGAELAAQQRAAAEAELARAAHEYAVLKLGALLLGVAIDRRRASHQDPFMARAGQLFALLTGGSFDGIGQDFDDDDTLRLVGRRPFGERVAVSGLSTGARDQLYLALRLAYLEDYAMRAEPPPFIGDDLFATFDDDRTAHGLAALAAIGDRVQPIVFTHHRHVAQIAQANDDVEVVAL
jgi:uncharacterized protein YhaN